MTMLRSVAKYTVASSRKTVIFNTLCTLRRKGSIYNLKRFYQRYIWNP